MVTFLFVALWVGNYSSSSPLSLATRALPIDGKPSMDGTPSVEDAPGISKPTYSFIISFGVPKIPSADFDTESLVHRLTVFVLCLDTVMATHDVSAELIIVQWMPAPNESLTNLVNWEQLNLKSLVVRIIEVPEEVAKRAPPCLESLKMKQLAKEGVVCFEFVAKNAGVRRSFGEFLVLLNTDDIMTPQLGELFANSSFWKGNTYWRAKRIQVPEVVPLGSKSGQEVYRSALELVEWKKGSRPDAITPPFLPKSIGEIGRASDYNAGDFMLIRSDDFYRIGSYPELGTVHTQWLTHFKFLHI